MKDQGLQKVVGLVTAAADFAAALLEPKLPLRIFCEKLLLIWQRFFGRPPFRYQALADGIRKILSPSSPPVPGHGNYSWGGRPENFGKTPPNILLTRQQGYP